MSQPNDDRFLKIATFGAIIALIVGGSFYFGTVLGPSDSGSSSGGGASAGPVARAHQARVAPANPSAPPASAVEAVGSDAVDEDAPNPLVRAPMAPSVLDLATSPRVMPSSELASVEEELALALPDIEDCWRAAVGPEPKREGKVFIHFTINDDGEPADLTVQSKGIGEPAMLPCVKTAAERRVYGNSGVDTTVYWPVTLDPEKGAQLR
jgi:hypothetical protein